VHRKTERLTSCHSSKFVVGKRKRGRHFGRPGRQIAETWSNVVRPARPTRRSALTPDGRLLARAVHSNSRSLGLSPHTSHAKYKSTSRAPHHRGLYAYAILHGRVICVSPAHRGQPGSASGCRLYISRTIFITLGH